jgi:hypothetical protein
MNGEAVGEVTLSMQNLTASIHTDGRWIGDMFDDFQLFPVIGDDPKTIQMLSGESLIRSLFKVVLKRANLSVLVNSLTGLSLLAQSKDGNLLEEAYGKIEQNIELKRTINDRVRKAYYATAKAGMAFAYVKESLSPKRSPVASDYLGPLFAKIDSIDRKFVSVSGVLCRIERAQTVSGANIAKSLKGSGVVWVLADYPFFVMGRPEFHNGVILLNMNQDIVARIENALPFWAEVGWYPYVRISGECRYPHSPKYVYPSITPSWIEYRTPKKLDDVRAEIGEAYTGKQHVSNAGFGVLRENPLDVLAYVDIIRILAKGANLDVSDFRWLDDVLGSAKQRLEATKAHIYA